MTFFSAKFVTRVLKNRNDDDVGNGCQVVEVGENILVELGKLPRVLFFNVNLYMYIYAPFW